MAKRGTMDPNAVGAPTPLPGVPHIGNKLMAAPKQRNNLLNVRVAPVKRTLVPTQKLRGMSPKEDKGF